MRFAAILTVGLGLMFTSIANSAETISHPELGFQMTIPDGFEAMPDAVKGDVLYAFQRPPEGEQNVGLFIIVKRMRGLLGRQKIDPKVLASANPQATLMSEKWKEFEIEVSRVPERIEEIPVVTFNAQAPLKPEAVQIAVMSEVSREAEIRNTLQTVLLTLDGKTNWLTDKERLDKLGYLVGLLIGIVAAIPLAIYIRKSWVTSSRKKANPPARSKRPRRDVDPDL